MGSTHSQSTFVHYTSPYPEIRAIACARVHTRAKSPARAKKSSVTTSLSTVQSHVPNRNFIVAATTLMTVTLCFHISAVSCFVLNETFDMLQEQEAMFLGYTTLGAYVQFYIIKSNCSCK